MSEQELKLALCQQRTRGLPLGRTLVQDKICTESDVARALSLQAGLNFVDLDREPIDPSAAALLPEKFARERSVVPLRLVVDAARHEQLHVALAAPAHVTAVDDVRAVSGKARVIAFVAADGALSRALWRLYPRGEAVDFSGTPVAAPLMLYGFSHVEVARLENKLGEHGVRARGATPHDVLAAGAEDVVIASLDTVEQLAPPERPLHAALICVGEDPVRDFARAQALGARGFVVAPVDLELLLRAIRRFRPEPPAHPKG